MKFKALIHKTLPDTFGVFASVDGYDTEIFHSPSPQLLGIATDMEHLRKYYQGTTAVEQLEDYEVVTVEVTVLTNENK
jgi:uncharacterized protein YfaP (DUF2135 family)